ncbi:hypothetical protein K435DRAFT_231258 [Dendrothele bispora CBS 962.96]|uniref:Uncharacterized protein n=1 Tax=Dendrothele bispora (strain CBS 962.96) TaxID=1314807 RepID=A0A4S8LRH8_DENBC|nr:hypothetical protein K435DRAFT_231258 [Dendrothele bispora CBS 962.96]
MHILYYQHWHHPFIIHQVISSIHRRSVCFLSRLSDQTLLFFASAFALLSFRPPDLPTTAAKPPKTVLAIYYLPIIDTLTRQKSALYISSSSLFFVPALPLYSNIFVH